MLRRTPAPDFESGYQENFVLRRTPKPDFESGYYGDHNLGTTRPRSEKELPDDTMHTCSNSAKRKLSGILAKIN